MAHSCMCLAVWCRYMYNGYWRHKDEAWGIAAREGPIAIEAGRLSEMVRTPTRARRHLRTVGGRAGRQAHASQVDRQLGPICALTDTGLATATMLAPMAGRPAGQPARLHERDVDGGAWGGMALLVLRRPAGAVPLEGSHPTSVMRSAGAEQCCMVLWCCCCCADQAVREKLVSYADEPFAASLFLLEPQRMERLQVRRSPTHPSTRPPVALARHAYLTDPSDSRA